MYNDRDLLMQGRFVSGTINFGDQGSQKIRIVSERHHLTNWAPLEDLILMCKLYYM